MKIFKLMAIALVAMVGLNSCSKDCDHEFIEVDYSNDIVGTWTIIEPDHSAAYVFNADGTVSTTGVDGEGYWEDVNGTYSVVNNKITMAFDSGHNIEGSFDLIPGQTFSFVDKTGRHTYSYCKEDLADEVVGMWVSTGANVDGAENVAIQTYQNDGKAYFTGGFAPEENGYETKAESTYKVISNLMIQKMPAGATVAYITRRLTYVPNGTTYGDILICESSILGTTTSWLRIKQSLDLAGKKYDYIKTFVSNVKGEDKDIDFMGYTFNFAKMDGSGLDKMLKALLFAVEFPNANKLSYSYMLNNNIEKYDASIVVEGNKMTIKMSDKVATLKDVVLYAFQDADCSQLHFYMHKTAFVNFYTNMQAMLMEATDEQFDIYNADSVNAIYNNINNAVQTINVSLVME
jgi:hypothetical protein